MDSDLHLRIDALGERRRQGLAIADSALNDAVDLLPLAFAAGVSKDEVAELMGVSRQQLEAVARRRRKDPEFSERLHRQLEEIRATLDQLAGSSRRPDPR